MTNGRGIEVTVERDDGQRVTIAQRDDGDIQLGDRVQIVEDRGVARAVRDTSRTVDRTASNGPPSQYYPPQDNSQPPQQYQPQDYGARQQSRYGGPQPQNDPRYGNLNKLE